MVDSDHGEHARLSRQETQYVMVVLARYGGPILLRPLNQVSDCDPLLNDDDAVVFAPFQLPQAVKTHIVGDIMTEDCSCLVYRVGELPFVGQSLSSVPRLIATDDTVTTPLQLHGQGGVHVLIGIRDGPGLGNLAGNRRRKFEQFC
ncbi:MAG: hypothetical protein ACR2JY_07920 [Chloroflexota bacterium]